MVSMRVLTLFVLFATVLCAENYGPVLRAIDDMIAREEQRQHLLEHAKNLPHSGDLRQLPHDYAYTDDYSVRDLVDGVAYVDALSGQPKPTLPVFSDKDKSDFTRVEVPSASLSDQQKLHQQLINQQSLLADHRKDNQLKQQTLEELLKEEERLKNPLNGLPQFTTDEDGNKVAFVQVCTPNMPNGIACPGGRCQNGKCKQDQGCYGDCCQTISNSTIAKPHGTPCNNGQGACLEGRCRSFPVCIGECCTGTNKDVAKPNGTPCAQGHCFEGGCTSDVGCTAGECCNMHKKRLFPKGFPCHASNCQEKSFCTGTSAFCPESASKPDESVCTGGMCKSGFCAKTGVVSANATAKICTAGPCCDVEKGVYLAKGASCSNNPCATGGSCSGFSADCGISNKAVSDGTPCPSGKCKEGVCIAIAMCEAGDECCVNGVLHPDYHVCNGGRCFRGKCVHDVPCLGACCKPHNGTGAIEPVANGTPCNNGTDVCQGGKCVSTPLCVGTCCEATGVAVDGKPCNSGIGKCVSGKCVDATKKCTEGTCCDEVAGLLRPHGFPCRANACSEEMFCTGTSTYCPVSLLNRADGTPCPNNGKCSGGKCVLPPKHVPDCIEGPCCNVKNYKFLPAGIACGTDPCRETTYCTGSSAQCPVTLDILPDGTVCKLTDKASTDWKCDAGVCKEPPPTFHMENIDIDMTRPTCNVTSGCCNTQIGRVRAAGYICSVAQTPCMKDVHCDGVTPACSPVVLEDGAACPGGSCVHGFCVKGIDPTDTESVHEIHIHVVPKEKRELSPSEMLHSQLLEDDEDEESSGSLEELLTIVTREVDGKVTERQMRIPLNALEKAKAKSLGLAGETTEKAERKLAERTAKVEAEARARIEAMKNANATATNTTVAANATNTTKTTSDSTATDAELKKDPSMIFGEPGRPRQHQHQHHQQQSAIDAFTASYPMPRTGIIDPLTGVVRLTSGPRGCKKGACCDKTAGAFYTRGFQCATPKNLCKMAACTGYSENCYVMDRPDGAACPGGHCFEGECIKACVGECCDHHRLPRPNGVGCGVDSFCYEGVCVHNCTGECCNEFGFGRPDGASCKLGYCYEGKCLQTRDNMKEEARHAAQQAGVDVDSPDFDLAIPLYTHAPPRNMEEEWSKAMAKAAAEKEAEEALKDAAAKREQELKKAQSGANLLNAVADQVNLQAAKDAKAEKGLVYALIGTGGFVGLLVIVAIIVAVVASKKKKTQKKDFDEYYDKF